MEKREGRKRWKERRVGIEGGDNREMGSVNNDILQQGWAIHYAK